MPVPITNTSAFLPFILPFAPGCPAPVAEFQLRLAAIEFCERTLCWREIVTQEVTQNRPAIAAPATATIHRIEEATLNGLPLTPTQFTAATDELAETPSEGTPKYLTQASPNEVAIYPFAPGTLRMSVFLKPRSETLYGDDPLNPLQDRYNVVPMFMLIQHAEKLANGALARILAIPSQPFSNPAAAGAYRAAFDGACTGQFGEPIQGQQRARIRTKIRTF